MVLLLFSLGVAAPAEAGSTCAEFLARGRLAGAWDLASGAVDEGAVEKLRKKRVVTGSETRADRSSWTFAPEAEVRRLEVRRDPGDGRLLAVIAEIPGEFGPARKTLVLPCGTLALRPSVAAWGNASWRPTERAGLYAHGDGRLAWLVDGDQAWVALGATRVEGHLAHLRAAFDDRDHVALAAVLRRVHQGRRELEEAMLPSITGAMEELQRSDGSWERVRDDLQLVALLHLLQVGLRSTSAVFEVDFYTQARKRTREAAAVLAVAEADAGRIGSALEIEALLRTLLLDELPPTTTRAVGTGWDDAESRRLDLVVLQAAKRSLPPLDPRSGLPHELALGHGYGRTPGLTLLGVHLPAAWAGWMEAHGEPVIRPVITWDDHLEQQRASGRAECVEVRRLDDLGHHESWRAELAALQGSLTRARMEAVPPPGVEAGYGAGPSDTIQDVYGGPWLRGASTWSEAGLREVETGARSWWTRDLSAASASQRETLAALDALVAAEPVDVTQAEVKASFERIVDTWKGPLGRTVVLDSVGTIDASVEVDLRLAHVEGALCVRRHDELAPREVVRERMAVEALDPPLLEVLREATLVRIDMIDATGWTEDEARRERLALKRLFLAPTAEVPWSGTPFVEPALAAGVWAADGTAVLVTHESVVRYRLADGVRLEPVEIADPLLGGFEIEAAAVSFGGDLIAVRVPAGLRVIELLRDGSTPRLVASWSAKVDGELVFLPDGDLLFEAGGPGSGWSRWDLDGGGVSAVAGNPSATLPDERRATWSMVPLGKGRVLHLHLEGPEGEISYVQPRGISEDGWVFFGQEPTLVGPGPVALDVAVPPVASRGY